MPGEIDVWILVLSPSSVSDRLGGRLSRRAVRIVGQAAAITALVAGTAAYAAANTTVELTVDGETQEVRAFGNSVADVLEAADITVGDRDVVAPGLDEKVEDGQEVVVRHARELTLTVDGATQTHWTTALTVGEALDDLAVRTADARVSASRSTGLGRQGLDVEVSNPKDVQVLVDGQVLPVVTHAETVADVLSEAGVTVAEGDLTSVPGSAPVADGLVVQVTRIATDSLVEEHAVEFTTEERKTDDLFEDQKKVEQRGEAGVRTVTFEQTTANGTEIAKRVVSDEVTKQPVNQIVLIGTKERPAPAPAPAAPSAAAVPSGSVWDRLAECESGGNWSINTGNGYYGGLQFSLQTWRAYGGSGMPHENSREGQIAIAEKVQAGQGWGAWPSCSRKLGLS